MAIEGPQGRHIEFLARTGNAERALTRIEEHQAHLVTADSPRDRWSFLLSVGTATSCSSPTTAAGCSPCARYRRSRSPSSTPGCAAKPSRSPRPSTPATAPTPPPGGRSRSGRASPRSSR
ncbi:hypothetical protein NKG05_00575 [Oerskovia sp. M15]